MARRQVGIRGPSYVQKALDRFDVRARPSSDSDAKDDEELSQARTQPLVASSVGEMVNEEGVADASAWTLHWVDAEWRWSFPDIDK